MVKKIVLHIILIHAVLFGAKAQNLNDTTIQINEIQIVANRQLPQKGLVITRIDSMVLQQTIDVSLSELLSRYSPVFIKSYGKGALATASFRGTAASHTQVEWNGININNPMVGQVDFSLIPVYFADKVELFHGGSSLSLGSGALGGSVSISSVPVWNKKIYGSVIQGIGSFSSNQTFVKIGGGNQIIQTRVRLFYEDSENDFDFLNTANGLWNNQEQKNADYYKWGGLIDLYFRTKQNDIISFHTWLGHTDRNLPAIMSYQGKGRDENQQDSNLRFSGSWKKYAGRFKSELTFGFSFTSLDYYLANQTDLGTLLNYNSESKTNSFFNKFKVEVSLTENTVINSVLNLNYNNVSQFDKKEKIGMDASRTEMGATISLHHSFSNIFSTYGLLRNELVDRKLMPLMPSVGWELDLLNKQLNITSNFTRNYHQPTLNDLYWQPGGNPGLKPEKGYSADISVGFSKKFTKTLFLKTGLSGYVSRIDDWIIWRPSEFRYWRPDNIKEVLARGIEYSLMGNFISGNFRIDFSGNYAFTRTTNQGETTLGDNSKGKQLIYIPLHKANGLLKVLYKKTFVTYDAAFTGERFTTSSNETSRHRLQAYTLHNATIGKSFLFRKITVDMQLKVENVLGKTYQAILWRPMPGRSFMFQTKVSF